MKPEAEATPDWREKLLTLHKSLEHELASCIEDARPVDLDQAIGRLSRMDAMQMQQLAIARRGRIKNQIQAVAAALRRLDAGTFGECLRCEEDIEPGRLEARPESPLCLNCQKARV